MTQTIVVHVNSPEWAQAVKDGTAVYIGRAVPRRGFAASKWANPFKMRNNTRTERHRVICLHAGHLLDNPELLDAIDELRDKVLGCWCAPEKCHGHTYVALLYWPRDFWDTFLRDMVSGADDRLAEWTPEFKRKVEEHFARRSIRSG